MIAGVRSKLLSKASASDTKQLWQLLRNTRNWSRSASNSAFQRVSLSLTANDLNAYFTDSATDTHYSRDMLDDNLRCFGDVDLSTFVPFNADFLPQSWAELGPHHQGLRKYPTGSTRPVQSSSGLS